MTKSQINAQPSEAAAADKLDIQLITFQQQNLAENHDFLLLLKVRHENFISGFSVVKRRLLEGRDLIKCSLHLFLDHFCHHSR